MNAMSQGMSQACLSGMPSRARTIILQNTYKQHTIISSLHVTGVEQTCLQHHQSIASQAVDRFSGYEAYANCTPAMGRRRIPANAVSCVHLPAADVAPAAHHEISLMLTAECLSKFSTSWQINGAPEYDHTAQHTGFDYL